MDLKLLHTDTRHSLRVPIKRPCRCVSVPALAWALSSRACPHPRATDTHEAKPTNGTSNPMIKPISGGVAHDLPPDLRKVLTSDPKALAAWEDLTPLARNEWICWVISVKKPETRREHVERVCAQPKEGTRRPCCWMGCTHRTDKSLSPSQKFILGKRSKK